jgi:hypothetical protein
MRGTAVVPRALVVAVVMGVTAPVAAQQPSAEGADSQTKFQVRMYAQVLGLAIQHAGERLADRANQIVQSAPNMALVLAADPNVRFVPTPEGPVFDVQVPQILPTSLSMWQLVQSQQQAAAQPVSTPDQRPKVTSASVPPADPMTVAPVGDGKFDPDEAYTAYVREALIDAMLDNSSALPLKDTDRLEIVASGLDTFQPNPLYPDKSRKLVLVIAAPDLELYRQGRISKDDAKKRIKESKF